MWQQWVAAIMGLVVLAVPFLNLSGEALTWTLVVAGAGIAALNFWGASQDASYYAERKSELNQSPRY